MNIHGGNAETRYRAETAVSVGPEDWDAAAAWGLFHHTNERILSRVLPPGEPWDSLWWERSEAMRLRDWPRLVGVCAEMVAVRWPGEPR